MASWTLNRRSVLLVLLGALLAPGAAVAQVSLEPTTAAFEEGEEWGTPTGAPGVTRTEPALESTGTPPSTSLQRTDEHLTGVLTRDVYSLHPLDITLVGDRVVTVSFVRASALHQNALGWYAIGDEGQILSPEILWANTTALAMTTALEEEVTVTLGELPRGTRLAFFLVSDGYEVDGTIFQQDRWREGTWEFRTRSGAQATIDDERPLLVFIDAIGNETGLMSQVYHSPVDPEETQPLRLNPDGQVHVRFSADDPQEARFLVGFEDLAMQGDRDFNDVVVAVQFER